MFLIETRSYYLNWLHKTQELSLEGLNLSDVPSEVWESGEITKVNLSKNSIEELPAQLSTSVSLQVIGLPYIFFLYIKKDTTVAFAT